MATYTPRIWLERNGRNIILKVCCTIVARLTRIENEVPLTVQLAFRDKSATNHMLLRSAPSIETVATIWAGYIFEMLYSINRKSEQLRRHRWQSLCHSVSQFQ